MNFPLNSKPFLIDSPCLLLAAIFLLSFLYLTKLRTFFLRIFDLGFLLMAEPSPIIETLDESPSDDECQTMPDSSSNEIGSRNRPPRRCMRYFDYSSDDDDDLSNGIFRNRSAVYGDLYNRRPRRYMQSFDYSSDDDVEMELPKPIDIFSCSSPENKPTGVVCSLFINKIIFFV